MLIDGAQTYSLSRADDRAVRPPLSDYSRGSLSPQPLKDRRMLQAVMVNRAFHVETLTISTIGYLPRQALISTSTNVHGKKCGLQPRMRVCQIGLRIGGGPISLK